MNGTRPAPKRGLPAVLLGLAYAAAMLAAAGCGEAQDSPSLEARRPLPTMPASAEQIARGAYLAKIGNCAGCHTAPGGATMAGGRRVDTPYGAVYAGNLTPDMATGIGRWSAQDFHRAMHEGRSRDGSRLIPAFPYTSFTRVAREDNDAIFAYLRSLPAVRQPNRPHQLRFPYGTQAALTVWQWLNFTPSSTVTSAPIDGLERGEYLVNGLGHCGQCHAPRGRWYEAGIGLDGGPMPGQSWYAPSLHPEANTDAAQTVAVLRDGINDRGTAVGPMARVVLESTQHWLPRDLELAAQFLSSLPPRATPESQVDASTERLAQGSRLYQDRCADCHGSDGTGARGAYPPLAGNPSVVQPNISNLVQILRHGGFPASTRSNPRPYGMPPVEMSTDETAAVLTYVRRSWGNRATTVEALDVLKAR